MRYVSTVLCELLPVFHFFLTSFTASFDPILQCLVLLPAFLAIFHIPLKYYTYNYSLV